MEASEKGTWLKERTKKKIKVSHTIDEKYIKLIDSDVQKKRFGSRSHAIEYALDQILNEQKN